MFLVGLDGETAQVSCEVPMTKIFAVSVPQSLSEIMLLPCRAFVP